MQNLDTKKHINRKVQSTPFTQVIQFDGSKKYCIKVKAVDTEYRNMNPLLLLTLLLKQGKNGMVKNCAIPLMIPLTKILGNNFCMRNIGAYKRVNSTK